MRNFIMMEFLIVRFSCRMGDHSMKETTKKKTLMGLLFTGPSIILITIFLIVPIVMTIYMSFFDRTLKKNTYIGLENYRHLLSDATYHKALGNTMLYALILIPLIVIITMVLASIIIKKKETVGSVYRGLFYLPTIASGVTVSIVWSWVFHPVSGIANFLLETVGAAPVEWFSGRSTAFICVCIVTFFVSIGQPIILYTAAMGGIDSAYYEAADLDGANAVTKFFRITMPEIRPTTLYVTIITAINAFQIFIPVQLLTNGGPVNSTTSMMYILYKTAFTDFKFGYAASMGVILLIIIGTFSIVQFKMQSRD